MWIRTGNFALRADTGRSMARLAGVPARSAGLYVRLSYFFTRRQVARLTGRTTERMIEPLEMYALAPGLLRGYGALEQATARLPPSRRTPADLAELKAATLTQCAYCIDMGSQIARRSGLSDEYLLALPCYKDSPLFSDLDKLVLDYAVALSRTPVEVSDALFANLRQHLGDAQLLERTHVIASRTCVAGSTSHLASHRQASAQAWSARCQTGRLNRDSN